MMEPYTQIGILKAAQDKGIAKISPIDLRHFAVDKHGTVDSRPYGGGDGMVLRPEPLAEAVKSIPGRPYVILTTPAGKIWNQERAQELSQFLLAEKRELAIVCGRFSGVDARFVDHYVDEEVSLGQFILSGGELVALCLLDSLLRLVPGVLGNEQSAIYDSFSEGLPHHIEQDLYSRPREFEGLEVPPVLLSGDHQKIKEWCVDHQRALGEPAVQFPQTPRC